jgi:hypothetical protein
LTLEDSQEQGCPGLQQRKSDSKSFLFCVADTKLNAKSLTSRDFLYGLNVIDANLKACIDESYWQVLIDANLKACIDENLPGFLHNFRSRKPNIFAQQSCTNNQAPT